MPVNNPPSSHVIYTELDPGTTTTTASANSTWENFDLSSIVGSKETAVDILCMGQNAGGLMNSYIGVRSDGSSQSRIAAISSSTAAYYQSCIIRSYTDTNGIIEIYASQKDYITFKLIGYET